MPWRDPKSAPVIRPKSFGEKWPPPPPAPGNAMLGNPKLGGRASMDAIVEAMVEVGGGSEGRPADGGLEAGDKEDGERSGEEEAAAGIGLADKSTWAAIEVAVGDETVGGEADSLNWERSVGPPDGADGTLNMLLNWPSLQARLGRWQYF